MTQGFDYSKLTGKLYTIAEMADNQGKGDTGHNGKLEGNELSIFGFNAKLYLGNEGYDYTQDDINAVLGLSVETAPVATNPIVESKKDGKKERAEVKDTVKELVKQGISPEELIKALKDEKYGRLTNPKYANEIAEVEYVLNAVGTYNSKEDVEKIHDKVKKQLKANGKWDSFHKDLLDSLEKQAEANQVDKEYRALVKDYNKEKDGSATKGAAQNFEGYYKAVESKVDKKKSYTKEALKKLKEFAQEDAKSSVVDRMKATTSTGKMGIRSELRKQAGDDDFQKDAIQDLKTERKIIAREHKVNNKIEELSSVSREELKKQLGEMGNQYNFAKKLFSRKRIANNIYDKLDKSYLPKVIKADGNYDLSELAQVLKDHIGADYKANQSKDKKMSEVENIRAALKDLTGEDFSDNQIGVLVNLFDFKREHVDRTPRVLKAIGHGVTGAMGGAFGSAASSDKLNVTQCVNLKFDSAAMADDIIKELDKQGIEYSKTSLTNGKLSIKILQQVSIDDRLSNILVGTLGGAALGVLTSAMADIIFGNVQDEKSCYSVSDYQPKKEVYKRDENGNLIKDKNGKFVTELVENTTYTKPEEYKKHFANTTKNPEKIQAMNTLVDAYVKKYGDNWHSELHQAIIRMAGTGSKLNPEECKMMKFHKPVEDTTIQKTEDKKEEKTEEKTVVPEAKEDCHLEYKEDIKMTDSNKYTWGQIINMYYKNCLTTHTPKEIWTKLKQYNNIPSNVNYIPAGIVLPYDLFGDGECERTKRQDVKRVKVKRATRVKKFNGQLGDTGIQARNVCKNADGSYSKTPWSRRHKDKASLEQEARENGWIK